MKSLYVSAAVLISSATLVQAQEDLTETPPRWQVSAELGAINTTGNTETTSINGKINVKHTMEKWHNEYIASALYKEDMVEQDNGDEDKETTAEKYFVSAKSAYQLEDEFGNLFVFASHAHDEFGSYRKYTTVSAGYGARFINRERLTLDAEIGPGYFWGDKVLEDDVIVEEEGAMVRLAGELAWVISENATFTQKLAADAAEDNTRYLSDTALSTKISDRMQMKVGYTVSHDTDVADDKDNTDTTTYINLVYNF